LEGRSTLQGCPLPLPDERYDIDVIVARRIRGSSRSASAVASPTSHRVVRERVPSSAAERGDVIAAQVLGRATVNTPRVLGDSELAEPLVHSVVATLGSGTASPFPLALVAGAATTSSGRAAVQAGAERGHLLRFLRAATATFLGGVAFTIRTGCCRRLAASWAFSFAIYLTSSCSDYHSSRARPTTGREGAP
jgi:hypothetical protein